MAGQRILIDTSILIDHLRKKKKDKTLFFRLTLEHECVISVITEFEFAVGSTDQNREFSEKLLAKLPIITFDTTCVQTATEIYSDLKSSNQLIALPDIFIAATALAYDLPLITLNRKHFARVKNLQLQKIVSP